jgi:hypothetical protein
MYTFLGGRAQNNLAGSYGTPIILVGGYVGCPAHSAWLEEVLRIAEQLLTQHEHDVQGQGTELHAQKPL